PEAPRVALQDEQEPLPLLAPSARFNKKGPRRAVARHERPRRLEVIDERVVAAPGNRNITRIIPPARAAHERPLAFEVDVLAIERDQLADAHAGGVQQLEHRPVPLGLRRRAAVGLLEKPRDLFRADGPW